MLPLCYDWRSIIPWCITPISCSSLIPFFYSVISHGKRDNCTKGRHFSSLTALPISDGGRTFRILRLTTVIRDISGWRDWRQLHGIVSYTRLSSLHPIIRSSPKWTLNRDRFRQTQVAAAPAFIGRPSFSYKSDYYLRLRLGYRLWFVVYRLYRPAASFRTPFVKPDGNR